jgi:hypothetical protein
VGGARLEDPPRLGEADLAAAAHEQALAQLALELPDVARQRRLGEMDALGAAAEAPRTRHREERLELAEGHSGFPIGAFETTYWTLYGSGA